MRLFKRRRDETLHREAALGRTVERESEWMDASKYMKRNRVGNL